LTWGPPQAYKLTEWEKEGTPVIRLQNLTGSGKDYYFSNLKLPKRQYCEYGDLLYMWSATFGPYIWKGERAIYHYHIWKVTCDEINITKLFLYHLLEYQTSSWMGISNGMGILHVTNHTEFKDSPVGRIPKGWDICLLDSIARRGSGHTPDKKHPEYWDGGIKWVSLADSFRLDTRYICETDKNISDLGIKNSSAVLHPKGTVIISRDAGIGKSTTLGSDMAVSQHFIAWVCSKKLNNFFLYYLLQLWKPKFEAVAIGSTIKTIGLPYFKKLKIPVPCVEEQQKIVSTLTSIDNNIEAKQKKLAQTKSLKKALMQDLLTGKVRVKV